MTVYAVPITKAKRTIPFDSELKDENGELVYSNEVMQAIFAEGLKVFANKNMSKIIVKDLNDEELDAAREAAFEKAQENLEALKFGVKRRKVGSKEPREVMTHAMNKARAAIKAAFKDAGKKTTGIKASVITEKAKELLAENPEILEEAREEVARMKQKEIKAAPLTGSLKSLIESAETAKPRVPPTRKPKADQKTVIAAKGKPSGKGTHATH